jgi:phosphatidylglycerophosphatase A
MDSGRVVSDEVIGQALALHGLRALVDPETGMPHVFWIGVAFLLFRIFDIVKPYPARTFDRMLSGWGVVLDDVAAGLYVGLFLLGISRIAGSWF